MPIDAIWTAPSSLDLANAQKVRGVWWNQFLNDVEYLKRRVEAWTGAADTASVQATNANIDVGYNETGPVVGATVTLTTDRLCTVEAWGSATFEGQRIVGPTSHEAYPGISIAINGIEVYARSATSRDVQHMAAMGSGVSVPAGTVTVTLRVKAIVAFNNGAAATMSADGRLLVLATPESG